MSSVFLQSLYMDKTRTEQSEELWTKTSLLCDPNSALKDVFVSSFKGLKATEEKQNTDDSSNWDDLNIWRSHLVCRAAAPSQKYCLDPSACPWLTIVLAINWRLHGFTNLPPPTSSSSESLLTAQHSSSRKEQRLCHPWAAASWLFANRLTQKPSHAIVGVVGGLLLRQHSHDEDHVHRVSLKEKLKMWFYQISGGFL